jgi:hypothetical protein
MARARRSALPLRMRVKASVSWMSRMPRPKGSVGDRSLGGDGGLGALQFEAARMPNVVSCALDDPLGVG